MRTAFVVLCVACAAPSAAQDLFPAWFVRGALGATENHGTHDLQEADLDSSWLEARVGRAFGWKGTFALDAGVAGSSGDGGFVSVTGGLEARALARSRVSPFLRLEAGFLNDSLGGCFVIGWGGGVAFRVVDPISLRAGVLLCDHCSDGTGPVVAQVGVEYRW